MSKKVEMGEYGEYQSSCNKTRWLRIGDLKLFYSYNTLIGFRTKNGLFISKNHWSTTTGKHLNWLDGGDKKNRLPYNEFKERLNQELEKRDLEI